MPPNVILILTDQLRPFELACYGNPHIRTPNIDLLARHGVRFQTAITNNPVCAAARSCLLSGQYSRTCTGEIGNIAAEPPSKIRQRLPDPTLAESFQHAGYKTALIGKWHVDPDPHLLGFDQAYFPLTLHRYTHQRFFDNHGTLGPPIQQYAPDHEAEKVDAFLAQQSSQKPFFLYYNISLPHMPIGPADMPPKYVNAYNPNDIPIRPNAFHNGQLAHSENWFKIYTIYDYFLRTLGLPQSPNDAALGYPSSNAGELPSDTLPPNFTLKNLYALYYGATSWVDDLVGSLMTSLAKHHLDQNTLVVFTSDHGDNLGSHQLFNKGCLYEESIRIPCIFWHPSTLAPRTNTTQIASLIDLMPTLLDLCHVPIPSTVQGQSLATTVRGQTQTLPRNFAFIETDQHHFRRPTIGIRTPTHLYGAYTANQAGPIAEQWALFNLDTDPLQTTNLPPTSPEATHLRAQLEAWHTQTPWLPRN